MPFLTQGSTNWKFIGIVAVLTVIAGAILIWQYFEVVEKIKVPEEIPIYPDAVELTVPLEIKEYYQERYPNIEIMIYVSESLPEKVKDWYKAQLITAMGWEEISEFEVDEAGLWKGEQFILRVIISEVKEDDPGELGAKAGKTGILLLKLGLEAWEEMFAIPIYPGVSAVELPSEMKEEIRQEYSPDAKIVTYVSNNPPEKLINYYDEQLTLRAWLITFKEIDPELPLGGLSSDKSVLGLRMGVWVVAYEIVDDEEVIKRMGIEIEEIEKLKALGIRVGETVIIIIEDKML